MVMGLAESLRWIRKEGLKNIFARHAQLARATREAMFALGLKLYAPRACSDAVTAVLAPPGVDSERVVKVLRDRHNLTIAGGQDQAKGKIFRIAHMGYVDKFDVIMAVAAVEMTLKELGHAVEIGKGVRAAMEVLAEKKA
jgi:aspartate aminotransferase-like enzyme